MEKIINNRWLPIDTAPKCGKKFIAYTNQKRPVIAYWGRGMKNPTFIFDGWWTIKDALTHWIDLPE
jgi:hypothetical protein